MSNHTCIECEKPADSVFDGQFVCGEHYNIKIDAVLTPEERKGKEEFDEVQRRYMPWFEEAALPGADPNEEAIAASYRDDAEDRLLEKSANARAYLRCLNHFFALSRGDQDVAVSHTSDRAQCPACNPPTAQTDAA